MILGGPAEMSLLDQYRAVRARTLELAAPLSPEDQGVQSMPDASPTKWHLAHTSWFFETFVLEPHLPQHRPFDPAFKFLFNSYYEGVGPQHDRGRRGGLSRPSLDQVQAYRHHVDQAMGRLLEPGTVAPRINSTITLGLHHEQQHQELLLTDIKHAFGSQPLQPSYHAAAPAPLSQSAAAPALAFRSFEGGIVEIGHQESEDGSAFAFDNEGPHHRCFLEPFAIADRPVTCGEYLAFMRDGGYARPELWLSDGWRTVESERWRAPLYWQKDEEAKAGETGWLIYTLAGRRAVVADEIVAHVSYYEADAYARWAETRLPTEGARLPTEEEWEHAASRAAPSAPTGHFADAGRLHPAGATTGGGMFGDVWQWTRSAYGGYPGYHAPTGAIGEYNGKFMSNQMVLRGGSCLTPAGHIRATYRNFFPPATRWQMSGIRLARDL
jgi:ergothioneine biosynthesis protein EgtB